MTTDENVFNPIIFIENFKEYDLSAIVYRCFWNIETYSVHYRSQIAGVIPFDREVSKYDLLPIKHELQSIEDRKSIAGWYEGAMNLSIFRTIERDLEAMSLKGERVEYISNYFSRFQYISNRMHKWDNMIPLDITEAGLRDSWEIIDKYWKCARKFTAEIAKILREYEVDVWDILVNLEIENVGEWIEIDQSASAPQHLSTDQTDLPNWIDKDDLFKTMERLKKAGYLLDNYHWNRDARNSPLVLCAYTIENLCVKYEIPPLSGGTNWGALVGLFGVASQQMTTAKANWKARMGNGKDDVFYPNGADKIDEIIN